MKRVRIHLGVWDDILGAVVVGGIVLVIVDGVFALVGAIPGYFIGDPMQWAGWATLIGGIVGLILGIASAVGAKDNDDGAKFSQLLPFRFEEKPKPEPEPRPGSWSAE